MNRDIIFTYDIYMDWEFCPLNPKSVKLRPTKLRVHCSTHSWLFCLYSDFWNRKGVFKFYSFRLLDFVVCLFFNLVWGLHFHVNFRISLPVCAKKVAETFVRVVLNLLVWEYWHFNNVKSSNIQTWNFFPFNYGLFYIFNCVLKFSGYNLALLWNLFLGFLRVFLVISFW